MLTWWWWSGAARGEITRTLTNAERTRAAELAIRERRVEHIDRSGAADR